MAKDLRAELKKLMTETLADHSHWSYRAVRPRAVPSAWHQGESITGDCSKGVQFLNKWVGAPDPMGRGYDEWGNSQTLWAHLQHLDKPADLQVGDIVTFGRNGESHAAMVLEPGSNPLLWSFGHQGAPNTYRLAADRRPRQYLRNPLPKYIPTPQDKLRAKKGYFSWVAWKLGEGDWQNYGAANKKVRPNVPRVIPPLWWKRYAQFLLNRKNGNEAGTSN